MRDHADNCVVICSIENVDPMGVHTGDSITVAPGADAHRRRVPAHARRRVRLHPPRRRRDRRLERAVRASNPTNGDMVVIEMNPRVSRSSRAGVARPPGFPIAKIAAKLAVGYTLDEIPQRHHPRDAGQLRADHRLRRHQDPALGVREVARRDAGVLGTQMQSVGEAMAIGRTFPESLQKALRSLEHGPARASTAIPAEARATTRSTTTSCVRRGRDRHARPALPARGGAAPGRRRRARSHEATAIDPWFLDQMLADRRGARRASPSVGLRRR